MDVAKYHLMGKEQGENIYLKLGISDPERIIGRTGPRGLYKEEGDIVYDNRETALEVAQELTKITGLNIIVAMDPNHFSKGIERKEFLQAENESGGALAKIALEELIKQQGLVAPKHNLHEIGHFLFSKEKK